MKSNRPVKPDDTRNVPIREVTIAAEGLVVPLKGDGMIQVFPTVSSDKDADSGTTHDLTMTEAQRRQLADQRWGIETYPRGSNNVAAAKRCQRHARCRPATTGTGAAGICAAASASVAQASVGRKPSCASGATR
jgi:hypothetical protein